MIPIGPLMREHRRIERMVELMRRELKKAELKNRMDPDFIYATVDFFRMYADRCHHGKEEDILFRDLEKRELTSEHRAGMDDLINDHKIGRDLVKELLTANEAYVRNEEGAFERIVETLNKLIEFYPEHIEKEDKEFFYPCMEYFSADEKDAMLKEFWDFDKELIHEKYERIVARFE